MYHFAQAWPGRAGPCPAIPANFILTFEVFLVEKYEFLCENCPWLFWAKWPWTVFTQNMDRQLKKKKTVVPLAGWAWLDELNTLGGSDESERSEALDGLRALDVGRIWLGSMGSFYQKWFRKHAAPQ